MYGFVAECVAFDPEPTKQCKADKLAWNRTGQEKKLVKVPVDNLLNACATRGATGTFIIGRTDDSIILSDLVKLKAQLALMRLVPIAVVQPCGSPWIQL